jgi:uroporphyrinogen III methyltransferase/synthase
MGVKNLPVITQKLIANGKSPQTPVALIRWGTTPHQQTVTGSLNNITERVQEAGLRAPAIIVVGDVVNLRQTLQWFEHRPLLGKRILVTRARQQASDMVKLLSGLGAECLEFPTIKIMPPKEFGPLDNAVQRLADYDWIVFTSVNGVAFFFDRLFTMKKDVRACHQLRIAAIGPATAEKLFEFGLKSDIVPANYQAEAVVEAFRNEKLTGKKILLPRAAEARPVLPAGLRQMGAQVDEITAYRTLKEQANADDLIQQLEEKKIDLITFTSSSTVRNFRALLPLAEVQTLLEGVTIASIGPITAATAQELGLSVHIIAESYTIPGLCDAILRYYGDAQICCAENRRTTAMSRKRVRLSAQQ